MVIVLEADDLGRVAGRLAAERPRVEGLRGLVESSGLLVRLRGGWRPGFLSAVDTAFPKSPVYLLGFTVSLVGLARVDVVEGAARSRTRSWVLAEPLGELDQDYVSAFARVRERMEALAALGEGAELVVLDGEIVPRAGRSPLWGEALRLSERLVDEALSAGRVVAGVLKRSYSRSMAERLGVEGVTDRVLASLTLRRGEALLAPHSDEGLAGRGCVEALYKPLRGVPAAVRVEACCPDRGRCVELLWLLASEAGASGLPWPIDLVDSLAKREASKVSAVAALLLSRLARGEAPQLGYASNPQETMGRRGSRHVQG